MINIFTRYKNHRPKPGLFVLRFALILAVAGTLLLNRCIEPYTPEINEDAELMVINGSLIKGEDEQVVTVSLSSPLRYPDYRPVAGCMVRIVDESGNIFSFSDRGQGTYKAFIEEGDLKYNRKYKLEVITPDGVNYESEFELLLESPTVDSVYGIVEEIYSDEREEVIQVVQFYLDLKASEKASRFYRWELDATWEHRVIYYVDSFYIPDTGIFMFRPQDSIFSCWDSEDITGLYSASTLNLERNEKKKIPLNYVDGTTNRMSHRYSLNVRQYALTESAYNYWNEKKVALEESGGLYTTQPSQTISNINNVDDPEEKVLGYFWASSSSEKRIFKDKPLNFRAYFPLCRLDTFKIPTDPYILAQGHIYIVNINLTKMTTDPWCLDCRKNGGDIIKPDFWVDW